MRFTESLIQVCNKNFKLFKLIKSQATNFLGGTFDVVSSMSLLSNLDHIFISFRAVIEAYLFLARKIYKPAGKTPAKSVKRIYAHNTQQVQISNSGQMMSRNGQEISPQNQATVQMSYQPQTMIINTSQSIAQPQILQISTLPNLNPSQQNFLTQRSSPSQVEMRKRAHPAENTSIESDFKKSRQNLMNEPQVNQNKTEKDSGSSSNGEIFFQSLT